MSISTNDTRWRLSKRWKTLLKIVLVIGIILLLDSWYAHYQRGQFTLDESLLERLEQIPFEAWLDRLPVEEFKRDAMVWSMDDDDYEAALFYRYPGHRVAAQTNTASAPKTSDALETQPCVDNIRIMYRPIGTPTSPVGIFGYYDRTSLAEWLRGYQEWGYCNAYLWVKTPQAGIMIVDFDSDGDWSHFEEALEMLLTYLEAE